MSQDLAAEQKAEEGIEGLLSDDYS